MKREPDDVPLMEQLRLLMVKVKQNGPRSMAKVVKTEWDETVDDTSLTLTQRQDMDLTDLLWDVLKKVESFSELNKAWEFVFQTIKRDEIRPYVSINVEG